MFLKRKDRTVDPSLNLYVDFLARNKTRATYAAVAGAIGVPPQSLGGLLGDKTHRASWVVSAQTGEPTGYAEHEKDPQLREKAEVIKTSDELLFQMRREGATLKAPRVCAE
jgi:hypothetical protein